MAGLSSSTWWGARRVRRALPSCLDGQAASRREVSVRARRPGELIIHDRGADGGGVGERDGRAAAADAEHAQGEQFGVAPMPGRVVRVLVAAGDEVAARQGVIVVEAMKMENELRSPRAGRIQDVAVSAGMSVEAGAGPGGSRIAPDMNEAQSQPEEAAARRASARRA